MACERTKLADRANEAGRASRNRGAPVLGGASRREDVLAWLAWCDRNGSFTDADCAAEGWDPLTESEAWDALRTMLEDA